jgi:membrane fusion protein (multidrug efflux system)
MRAGRVVDEQWLVLDGLAPGDRVVVEGFQKFEPGDIVDPVPWQPQSADGSSPPPATQESDASHIRYMNAR